MNWQVQHTGVWLLMSIGWLLAAIAALIWSGQRGRD